MPSFKETVEDIRESTRALRDFRGEIRRTVELVAASTGGGGGGMGRTVSPRADAGLMPFGFRNNLTSPGVVAPGGSGGGGGGGGMGSVESFARAAERLASAVERLDAGDNGLALRREGLV